jgi:hypothetical protein
MKKSFDTLPISAVAEHQKKKYHVPVVIEFAIKLEKITKRKSMINSFLYDKARWQEFYNELDRELIDVNTDDSSNVLCEKITSTIRKAAELSIPKSKVNHERKTNYPIHIVNLINEKRRLAQVFKNNNSQENGEKYKAAELECGDVIRDFNQKQWRDFIARMGPHPLSTIPFWRRINRLRNKNQQQNVSTLIVEGLEIKTNESKAKVLADRLEEVFSDDKNPKFKESHYNEINKKINEEKVDSFYTNEEKAPKPFTFNELAKGMENLNRKTSTDQDRISNRMLRQVRHSHIATTCLLELFNKCLREHQVPAYWKTSTVTMLHKKDTDASLPKSYRPISITPCLARLYERLLLARLKRYLKQHNILIKPQSGFRDHRSTKDNIIFTTQKIQQGFAEKKKTLGIFFDVASAFDKVWHNGLL